MVCGCLLAKVVVTKITELPKENVWHKWRVSGLERK